ncbi:hypothetical protein N7471_010581 [Penicillium samsonianum]|uniref:uncharacterized protein n=1 Tax=Penicillium samsonianum TaxID=1882272 RepID=UPI0025478534|nr:uncharacterized protein N7471_010581 [Penicillium samsonianum]KAJ6126088.1 hypothetical protein N7471_010581 [Penicillium samsonianum]
MAAKELFVRQSSMPDDPNEDWFAVDRSRNALAPEPELNALLEENVPRVRPCPFNRYNDIEIHIPTRWHPFQKPKFAGLQAGAIFASSFFNHLQIEKCQTWHNQKQSNRQEYSEEEKWFVWYKRVRLGQKWKGVVESFNRQFPNRQRHSNQGIPSMLYRFTKEKERVGRLP